MLDKTKTEVSREEQIAQLLAEAHARTADFRARCAEIDADVTARNEFLHAHRSLVRTGSKAIGGYDRHDNYDPYLHHNDPDSEGAGL